MDDGCVVVLPVKPPARGKSRLRGLPDDRRRDLAEAFALDTAAACLAATHVHAVLVATDDAVFASRLAAAGCATIPDGDASGLNAALRQAVAEARRRWPAQRPVALLADLPALPGPRPPAWVRVRPAVRAVAPVLVALLVIALAPAGVAWIGWTILGWWFFAGPAAGRVGCRRQVIRPRARRSARA